jgi:uncharacterized protein YycO
MEIKLLTKKNYLTMIKNAASGENNMFRSVFALVDGKEKDILNDGQLSCALVVSSILYLHKLIGDIHTTVSGTEKDMLKNGWREIKELKEGAVLIWEPKSSKDDQIHGHAGFYIGNDEAISNASFDGGIPICHHYTYGQDENGQPKRKIEKIYWHPNLG